MGVFSNPMSAAAMYLCLWQCWQGDVHAKHKLCAYRHGLVVGQLCRHGVERSTWGCMHNQPQILTPHMCTLSQPIGAVCVARTAYHMNMRCSTLCWSKPALDPVFRQECVV